MKPAFYHRCKLILYLASRYASSRYYRGFASFVSVVAFIGLALGTCVLLTVLSVMNGFDYEIKEKIFANTEHLTISSWEGMMAEDALGADVLEQASILAASPYLQEQAMIMRSSDHVAVMLKGVRVDQERSTDIQVASWPSEVLKQTFGLVLSERMAYELGVAVGDKVAVVVPKMTTGMLMPTPRLKQMTIDYIYTPEQQELSQDHVAYLRLEDAQTLLMAPGQISGWRLRVDNMLRTPWLREQLMAETQQQYMILDWSQRYQAFFHALQMQKTAMFVILTLVLLIALFNLTSSMMMMIHDKKKEIAIMLTMGMTPGMITMVFITQGMSLATLAITFGIFSGRVLSMHLSVIAQWVEHLFHVQFISASVWLIDHLPAHFLWSDAFWVLAVAWFFALLSTLYPARIAASISPADALRYE